MQCSGFVLLMLESRHNENSALSIRSPVVDEERTRPGLWLGSVLCVSFSALTCMGERKDMWPVRKPAPLFYKDSLPEQVEQ